MHIAENVAAN